jgi:hypothetical protein
MPSAASAAEAAMASAAAPSTEIKNLIWWLRHVWWPLKPIVF